jgi:hypothetical protein
MNGDQPDDARASSPFDAYISLALGVIADGGDVPSSAVAQLFSTRLGWLPGFSDVVLGILRTNGLIVVNEWEPGKVHITNRGRRWIDSSILSR